MYNDTSRHKFAFRVIHTRSYYCTFDGSVSLCGIHIPSWTEWIRGILPRDDMQAWPISRARGVRLAVCHVCVCIVVSKRID